MKKRKGISKKVRFEVFKRDKFKWNYGDWLDSIYHFDVQLYFDTMRERTNG